jgi:hypothetical protein
MDRFHRGLDPELYEKLNPIKTNNYHEIVDLAISQEDAMKKVQNAKKRKAAFNSNNAPKRKFRIVRKAQQNFQRNQRSGRWVAKPPQNQQQGNFRSPNFQQQNARPNAPQPTRTSNEGRCYNCGKPGHFMNACPQPRQQNQGPGQPQSNKDKGKSAPRYIGPYEITEICGPVAYHIRLPERFAAIHNVFHVSQLRKCTHEPEMRVINEANAWIQPDLSLVEHPMWILNTTERKTRMKSVIMYKVLWSHHTEEEATWETEHYLNTHYPGFVQVQNRK